MDGLRLTLGSLTLATCYAGLPFRTLLFNALAFAFADKFSHDLEIFIVDLLGHFLIRCCVGL